MMSFINLQAQVAQKDLPNPVISIDTISCYLVVLDTSTHIKREILGGDVLASIPPQYRYIYGDTIRYKKLDPFTIEGFRIVQTHYYGRVASIPGPNYFLDGKKSSLNRNFLMIQYFDK